ncbi:MAG: MBL fold metallo-hydrolase [Methylacidiphilales bacterium]|nr:MBL fold metallo-hydrolase [Candidatus Methylacidiphilales bacterium]MDW8349997.1 MBL fold metallo-hydrolase [Verrucomicrobiae bacterium]
MKVKGAERKRWHHRNFITDVLIPSLFARKIGVQGKPIFPKVTGDQIGITWIGHASFLIQTARHNVLIDPNWSNWLTVIRRLRRAGFALRDLPNIDLVLITHAHFDHLDRRSLRKIAERQPIVVPENVGNLVHDLGFERVHEMRWWEDYVYRGLKITFTPAKHWGARLGFDRHRGYGGYVIEYAGRRIYHSGDTTYFEGFKEIGRRCKPEIVLMAIGAYQSLSARDHHIDPEKALQAFEELGGKTFIPMHFGTYRISYEPMHEPAERLLREAAKRRILSQIRFLIEGMPQVF